jgi:hypothetical protein
MGSETLEMVEVQVKPLNKWAKNKVHQHGDIFEVRQDRGHKILVFYLNDTFKLKKDVWQKWCGWFDIGVDVEILESK